LALVVVRRDILENLGRVSHPKTGNQAEWLADLLRTCQVQKV